MLPVDKNLLKLADKDCTLKRVILVATAITMLVGCTTSKPVIPYQNYQQFALYDVAANKCVEQGFMEIQTAAAAKNIAASDMNQWTYDPVVYQAVYAGVQTKLTARPPTKSDCESYAIVIAQRQQQAQQAYQQQQLALQQQQLLNQSMQNLQNSLPKTTYCNQVGWQTVCNTY